MGYNPSFFNIAKLKRIDFVRTYWQYGKMKS